MDKSDGGPAFPYVDGAEPVVRGMSLRDYFASQVVSALVTSRAFDEFVPAAREYEAIAKSAYLCADAMLAERDRDDDNDR